MTSPYRSRLKISVMLMLRPSAIICSIGPSPSAVAGIFTIRFRRAIRSCRSRAAASVPAPSWARSGSTSTLTYPSTPSDASYTESNTSQAPWMSWMTSDQ